MSKIRFGRSETWRDYMGRHTCVAVYEGKKQIGTIGADECCGQMQYTFQSTDVRGYPNGEHVALSGNLNAAKRQFRNSREHPESPVS